jgi:hypothetical protein
LTDYNLNEDGRMPSFTHLAEIKLQNGLEAAELYTHMGLPVISCEGKAPILRDWPKCRLGLEDLPRHFGDGQTNVGLVLGEPSGGWWSSTSTSRRPYGSPIGYWRTPSVGGASSPRAHRYHRAPGQKNKKWLDTDGVVLLELHSTGSQTLIEPSIHQARGSVTPGTARASWSP